MIYQRTDQVRAPMGAVLVLLRPASVSEVGPFVVGLGRDSVAKHVEASLTFVVPALNEETVIVEVLLDVLSVCRKHLKTFEIIAVDDGSVDRTGSLMDDVARENPEVKVIHNPVNLGIGSAYKRGLAEASGDYFMLLCGDGGLPASSLPPIFEKIGQADIVVPYMPNLDRIKTRFRYILSRTYTGILNLIFGLDLRYFNGLPVHRVSLLRSLEINSDGFGFQGEILVKLIKSGHSYVHVAVPGAEKTNKSSALKFSSILSVGKTFFCLVWDVYSYLRSEKKKQEKQCSTPL